MAQHLSKKWPHRNTCEEVASFADKTLTVVAMFTMIQREFHETRERDNARARDFISDDVREGAAVFALPNRIQ